MSRADLSSPVSFRKSPRTKSILIAAVSLRLPPSPSRPSPLVLAPLRAKRPLGGREESENSRVMLDNAGSLWSKAGLKGQDPFRLFLAAGAVSSSRARVPRIFLPDFGNLLTFRVTGCPDC